MSTYQQLSDHYIDLYAIAYQLLRDADDAKDAVQDAITNTLVRIHIVRDPYFYCIKALKNICYSRIRERMRWQQLADDVLEIGGATNDPEAMLELQQVKALMPEEAFACLVLYDVEGYTIEEICTLSGKKRYQVIEQLKMARKYRKRLENNK